MTDRIFDASALKAYRENPELFRLRYRLHLVPQGREEAPEAGAAFHAALRRWFDTYDLDEALQALEVAWAPHAIATALIGGAEKRPLSLFERLMRGYAEAWPREREGFVVERNESYVEGTFAANSRPFRWCGILDRKVRYDDDSRYIMDCKTTSGWLNDAFFAALDLDVQLPGYVGLELVNGRRCDGYIVDAVHVNTRTQKVDRSCFVRHGPINVPQWKLTRWARDVEWTLRQIEALEAERGIHEPWPMYANFKFGSIGSYREWYETPPELHANVKAAFVESVWTPSDR